MTVRLLRPTLAAAALAIAAALPAAAAPACPALLQQVQPRLQDEKPVDLCTFAGKVLLVVNTASYCGYTPQYKALETLQRRYATRGLVVLGFPTNDFGQQEPGSNGEIAAFCENTFGVKFPMFAKSTVLSSAGPAMNPLFAALAKRTGEAPKWNFHKYLVSRSGEPVAAFASAVDPEDPKLVQVVERLLAQ